MENKPNIDRVSIFTLYGDKVETFKTVEEAVEFVRSTPDEASGHLVRLEVSIQLEGSAHIDGSFDNKDQAIHFIENRSF